MSSIPKDHKKTVLLRSNRYCQCMFQNGFTLVELLVVIAIIALLLSILMPALHKVREQGRAVVCMSNMKQIGLGVQMYLTDNKDTLPNTYNYTKMPRTSANMVIWTDLLDAVNQNKKVFKCPSDKSPGKCSYAPNLHLMPYWGYGQGLTKAYTVRTSAENLVLLTEIGPIMYPPPTVYSDGQYGLWDPQSRSIYRNKSPGDNGDLRHSGTSNYLFMAFNIYRYAPNKVASPTLRNWWTAQTGPSWEPYYSP